MRKSDPPKTPLQEALDAARKESGLGDEYSDSEVILYAIERLEKLSFLNKK